MSQTTEYELPLGALTLLKTILTSAVWYKDDMRQARLIVDAVAAEDALPILPEPLTLVAGETDREFGARVKVWGKVIYVVAWSDRHKEAVKKCLQYYIKNGNLTATSNTVALIKLLQIAEE